MERKDRNVVVVADTVNATADGSAVGHEPDIPAAAGSIAAVVADGRRRAVAARSGVADVERPAEVVVVVAALALAVVPAPVVAVHTAVPPLRV